LAHQAALAPLKQHWAGIDAVRKAKWLVVAQRFPAMPQPERQRVQARMAEWAAMTPSERGRARQNFQELRKLPHEDRQALWEAYRALPDEQKRALAQRTRPVAKATEPASAASGKRAVAVNPASRGDEAGHAHRGAGQARRDDQPGDQGTQPAVAPPAGHAEDHGNRRLRQSVDLVAQPRAPGCSDACSCTCRRRIGCL
jgi:hypothetical protein